MKILILGGDGYLGWPTAMYLSSRGHEVAVVDNYFRRSACHQMDAEPLVPVPNLAQRVRHWEKKRDIRIRYAIGDICNMEFLKRCFTGAAFGEGDWVPDGVVHYAEQPSAPYSMASYDNAAFTLRNNLMGTLNIIHAIREIHPKCHIVKLGTMGVYGTPNIDIEEGYLEVEHKGRKHTFLYPRTPGSLYHLTKVQDGDLLYFYTRMWDICVTDLNQGPVYGTFTEESKEDPVLAPIFNYDAVFGTVINRFLVQAVIGHPLTIFGKGGQIRGYLDIRDTMACVELALTNPADPGQYRVFNQVTETFTVNQLADLVVGAGKLAGLKVETKSIQNPRKEMEEHYYNPTYTKLKDMGLKPSLLSEEKMAGYLEFVKRYQDQIRPEYILPKVKWV